MRSSVRATFGTPSAPRAPAGLLPVARAVYTHRLVFRGPNGKAVEALGWCDAAGQCSYRDGNGQVQRVHPGMMVSSTPVSGYVPAGQAVGQGTTRQLPTGQSLRTSVLPTTTQMFGELSRLPEFRRTYFVVRVVFPDGIERDVLALRDGSRFFDARTHLLLDNPRAVQGPFTGPDAQVYWRTPGMNWQLNGSSIVFVPLQPTVVGPWQTRIW